MKNKAFADLLEENAKFLDMKGSVWEPRAYRRAAQSIEGLADDIESIYKNGGLKALEDIDGVGKAIAKKIEEFLKTGKVREFEEIKASIPAVVLTLLKVPGLGPKKVMKLYEELKIKSVDDLIKAGESGKIAKLAGFGEKSQEEILKSVSREKGKRYPLTQVLPLAMKLRDKIKALTMVQEVEVAGSIRRLKPTVKDIDILIVTKKPEVVMDVVTKLPEVTRVLAKGPTKSTLLLKNDIQCDVRVVPAKSFGAALAYFTGSKEHNIEMRRIALAQGKKLSEWGLFTRDDKYLVGKTEKEIYKNLGLPYVPPEKRETIDSIKQSKK